MTPPFKLHGDNHGNINCVFQIRLPGRWMVLGAIVLAIVIAAGAIGGFCWLEHRRMTRRVITPVEQREMRTGPRGGTYYINANGNRTYVSQPAASKKNKLKTDSDD